MLALVNPTLVAFLYMTEKACPRSVLERDFIQNTAEAEYHKRLLAAFFCCAWIGLIARLAYSRTVSGCSGGSAMLYVSLGLFRSGDALGICWLIHNTAVDPGLS